MSTTFSVIACHRSLSSICQARQFSIFRRSTQIFGVLTRFQECKFIHTERVRVRLHRNERLKQKVEDEKDEQMPSGLYNKLKYYLKRYWYIAVPVHSILCVCWFSIFYLAVHFGLDVVKLLEFLRLPENWIKKVKELPKAASTATAALLIYKIFTPIRYGASIVGTNLTYKLLKHFGLLRTARQIEYRGRIELEGLMKKLNERRISAAAKYRKKSNGNGGAHKGFNGSDKVGK